MDTDTEIDTARVSHHLNLVTPPSRQHHTAARQLFHWRGTVRGSGRHVSLRSGAACFSVVGRTHLCFVWCSGVSHLPDQISSHLAHFVLCGGSGHHVKVSGLVANDGLKCHELRPMLLWRKFLSFSCAKQKKTTHKLSQLPMISSNN